MTIHPDNFTVDPGVFEGTPVVHLRGVFRGKDAYTWAREEFNRIVEGGSRKLVIHLGGVEKIDSGAMGVLAEASVRMRKRGGTIKLAAVPDKIHHLLSITNLHTLFEFHPNLSSAVQ